MSPPLNTPTHPPSISRRLSIRFLPHPPSTEQVEPTDTLVLNGGGTTNLFTDFRPLREDQTKCEWTFAGVKKFLDDGRCQWDHLVDNRASETVTGDDSEILPDIGSCSTTEDGTEVEHGTMLNPETGKVEEYVEVGKMNTCRLDRAFSCFDSNERMRRMRRLEASLSWSENMRRW